MSTHHHMSPHTTTQARQDELDCITPQRVDDAELVPASSIDLDRCTVRSSAAHINTSVDAMRNHVNGLSAARRVVSLDAEWDTIKNSSGMVVRSLSVAIIQLSYEEANGRVLAMILQATHPRPSADSHRTRTPLTPTFTPLSVPFSPLGTWPQIASRPPRRSLCRPWDHVCGPPSWG